MRSVSGHMSAREVEGHIQASRIKDLSAQAMTSREMNLDPNVINLLSIRGVIRKMGRKKEKRDGTRTYTYYNIYGPGPCYTRFCKKRGWV